MKMAGKLCPNCNELTFFKTTGENRKCSKCGYEMDCASKCWKRRTW